MIYPSARGELEVTDINNHYLQQGPLVVQTMGSGHAWLEAGTHGSILKANQFIASVENQRGLKVTRREGIAYVQQ